jgi:hypothetical protein
VIKRGLLRIFAQMNPGNLLAETIQPVFLIRPPTLPAVHSSGSQEPPLGLYHCTAGLRFFYRSGQCAVDPVFPGARVTCIIKTRADDYRVLGTHFIVVDPWLVLYPVVQ